MQPLEEVLRAGFITPTTGLPLFEDDALEFKAAQGKDGSGQVPHSFWSTYSAMANSDGGTVVLGIEEIRTKGAPVRYELKGIADPSKVMSQVWDGLNNRELINRNILSNQDVRIVNVQGKRVLEIKIRRAQRQERPIYCGANPLIGTYRRNFEGDYLCTTLEVRRLLADADNDSLDSRILSNYSIADLNAESIASYRHLLSATKSGHPYLVQDTSEFLYSIGAFGVNRDSGKKGATAAGLLMFGEYRQILEVFPNYHVDYRELGSQDANRWADRVTSDGSWTGNLFDFYQRASRKIVSEVKVPFSIINGQRVDDTRVGEALREAFVNALIHADFSCEMSILIEKGQQEYKFRNPGMLRIPIQQAFEGNHSDCRNRNLQTMFLLIGAAEKAGSGLPKIVRAWREQEWRYPLLRDSVQPEETQLILSTGALLPTESLDYLRSLFGDKVTSLESKQAIALCIAHQEGQVTNSRMQNFCDDHPREITKMLQGLVSSEFIESHGYTSGTFYTIAKAGPVAATTVSEFVQKVLGAARVPDEVLRQAILDVTTNEYLTPVQIGERLGRSAETLRRYHIREMVREGFLSLKFRSPNSPKQAYKASRNSYNRNSKSTPDG